MHGYVFADIEKLYWENCWRKNTQSDNENSNGVWVSITYNQFSFNKDKKEGETTFEDKLRGKITNELGNIMVPSAVEVIVIQFRKFMALTSYELLNRKDKYVNPKPELQGYFEFDSVW